MAQHGVRIAHFQDQTLCAFREARGNSDADLCDAATRAERGQVDAYLGGGVIKQRIARRGQGRSGGLRAIVLFRQRERSFFVYGFAKSVRDNLRRDELRAFRLLAEQMLGMDEAGLQAALSNGTITEVVCDD